MTVKYGEMENLVTPTISVDQYKPKIGEVNEVCFVEGLVKFKDKWFLYYGTGDSKIAVAVSDHGPL